MVAAGLEPEGGRQVSTAVAQDRPAGPSATGHPWYTRDAGSVGRDLGVDPAKGLTSAEVTARLGRDGPNALPAEEATPGWRRFLDEYRTYMQMILVGAAVVSFAIQEWSTAVILVAITLLNAVVGLRQQGKAESAMNALKSLMKDTARVRRDGTEAGSPPRSSLPATSCSCPQATRCPLTAGSSRRARSRSTSPP